MCLGGVVRRLSLSSILFTVVGIFSLIAAVDLHAEKVSDNTLKIGAIVDLTGPNAAQGQLNRKGMEDYMRYLNETTAGISGRRLSLRVIDGGAKVSDVLNGVEEFCNSEKPPISAVFSDANSEKIKPIFLKSKIPHIDAPSCQSILSPPVPYTYLPFGSTTLHCYAILQYIEMTHAGPHPPRVGILSAKDACGKSILAPSRAYVSNHRMEIVSVEQFTPGKHDLDAAMAKFKDMGAEYIVMQCNGIDAVTAFKSADRIHYNVPFFSPWKLADTDFLNRGKTFIRRRTNISFPGCLPGDGTPGIDLIKILMDRYKSVSTFHPAYWEGVSIAAVVARALQRAHEKLGKIDAQTVNLALETFQNEDFGSLIPEITYTHANHSASFVTRIARANGNGTFIPLTNFWNPKTEKVAILP